MYVDRKHFVPLAPQYVHHENPRQHGDFIFTGLATKENRNFSHQKNTSARFVCFGVSFV
jgi:hypothetical protein